MRTLKDFIQRSFRSSYKLWKVLMWLFLMVVVMESFWYKKNELWKTIHVLFIFIIIDSTCVSFWDQFATHICNMGFISIKWEHNKYRVYNDCFMWLPICQVAFLIITRKLGIFQTYVLDLRVMCHVSPLYWTDGSPVGLQSVCFGGWLLGLDKSTNRKR